VEATPLYQCKNLNHNYSLGNRTVQALNNVSLSIHPGDFTCLVGPSGSGKSTLLNLLGLIEPLQEGSIGFDGVNFTELTELEKNKIRRFDLGFIFQSFNLLEVLGADENVEYFLTRQGIAPQERSERTEAALKSVNLWKHRRQKPTEMSGGQRQRVAIARALAKNPKVILADEPTASLDQKTGREIMEILKRLNEEQGVTIIMATHDPMAISYAKKVIRLVDGKPVQENEETRPC